VTGEGTSGTAPGSTRPASAGSPATACSGTAPSAGWTCQGGRWVAPGAGPSASSPPGSSSMGSTSCVGTAPLTPSGARATCVDGQWVVP
jgi:hypothetical protein